MKKRKYSIKLHEIKLNPEMGNSAEITYKVYVPVNKKLINLFKSAREEYMEEVIKDLDKRAKKDAEQISKLYDELEKKKVKKK